MDTRRRTISYHFGLHTGHLTDAADRIALQHGAGHVNYTEPTGARRGWFEAENLGEPFDGERARAVMAAIEAAGGCNQEED